MNDQSKLSVPKDKLDEFLKETDSKSINSYNLSNIEFNTSEIFNKENDTSNVRIPNKLEDVFTRKKMWYFRFWSASLTLFPIIFFVSRMIRKGDIGKIK